MMLQRWIGDPVSLELMRFSIRGAGMNTGLGARTSVCRVERGLYALRYLEAASLPCANARVTVLSGDIRFIPAPGRPRDALGAPGQALVIVADSASEFEIEVVGSRSVAADAKFSIDRLDPGETSGDRTPAPTHRGVIDDRDPADGRQNQADEVDVRLTAHVSRRGDVFAGGGEWIAGPDAVLPVEGLSVATGRSDLGVRIRVQSARHSLHWSRWHEPGEFAGSRQQADGLTAIALALTGDAAEGFELVADVMALGMPPATKRGRLIEFFGVDPIVGFRFALQPVMRGAAGGVPAASPLRVFRAKR